jgi:nicotinate-nucleotide adenylyltransferase
MPSLYFGGSFNPIHHGHLRCAEAVAGQAGYDRVVLVPSARPPHKPDNPELAPPQDRLAMCRLAIDERGGGGAPTFEVSDIETRRSGPSYTIDTARELRETGEREVHWLIGADMLLYLPKWHRPLDLLREVHFVVMARPGWTIDWSALPPEFRRLKEHVVAAPVINISSTEVRRRVRQNLPIEDLVPLSVARYIDAHHLYRD